LGAIGHCIRVRFDEECRRRRASGQTLPFTDLGNAQWQLKDLLSDATYDREGNDLQTRGLYLDESPWQASVFSLTKRA
jgi:hypothetical protein